jgi:hypothetical protein
VWFEGRGHLGDTIQVKGARVRADGIEGVADVGVSRAPRELLSARSD